MKRMILLALFSAMSVYIVYAQFPNVNVIPKDSIPKRIEITGPALKAVIEYMGGDTLFVYVENQDQERITLRLLEDGVTLLVDKLKPRATQQRTYIISQFPQGTFTIRLKKGRWVVDETIVKLTPQM